jgi:2-haloacid dehalogenase
MIMKPKALTFDYFGTLVDVDRGGMIGIEEVLSRLSINTDLPIREVYLDWDIRTVHGYRSNAYQKYRVVAQSALTSCLENLAEGCTDGQDMGALTELLLTHLVESSPPFDDAVQFLIWAKDNYVLMPITNMDTDLWRRSQLTSYFKQVTTAEMAGAYKPSETIFKKGLAELQMVPSDLFHCSIGTWADIDGAKPLGIPVAWINRQNETLGTWQARPDYEFPTLAPVRKILEQLAANNND